MKKVYMIVQTKDLVGSLESLRDLGVVHVEPQKMPEGGMIPHYKEDIQGMENALRILQNYAPAEKSSGKAKASSGRPKGGKMSEIKHIASDIRHIHGEIEALREDINKRQPLIEQWESWGHFNPQDIRNLRGRGVYAAFAKIKDLKKAAIPEGVVVQPVGAKDSGQYLLITRDEQLLPVDTLAIPEISVREMKHRQEIEKDKIGQLESKLKDYAVSVRTLLRKSLEETKSKLMFEETVHSVHAEDGISILKGFCPEDAVEELMFKAQEAHWGFLVQDPSEDDQPPTLLQNPRWVKIANPIMQFMSLTPGYREIDISIIFLVFSVVFFGILIGDAGYGLLFLAITAWAHRTFRADMEDRAFFYLSYAMNACAVVWGFLSGTFFGTVLFGQWVKPMVPWLTDNTHLQLLCFVIGALHMSIGHLWNALLKRKTVGCLAEIGWVCILWYFVFIANALILGGAMASWMHVMFGLGVCMAFLFNSPQKTWAETFKVAGGDAIINFLNVIAFFGDILSYIRLFAVGLAGVAVADAFSSMAMAVGFASPGAIATSLLILLAGHALNLILVLFGFMVHGIRLNLLEFSGHIGVGWTGIPYQPLKLNSSHSK